jgi:hypothetical protein
MKGFFVHIFNRNIPLRLWLLCLVATLWLPGCGSTDYNAVSLEGSLSVNGKPVKEGGLTFSPLDAKRGRGVYAEVHDGRYKIANVPVGKIHVTFMAIEYTGKDVTILGKTSPESRIIVPQEHRAGMEIEIKPNDKIRDFNLQGKI